MNLRTAALGTLFSLCITGSVLANLVNVEVKYISPYDYTTESVTVNGSSSTDYTGLYNITVDGVEYKTFCIDPKGSISQGNNWTANYLSAEEITAGNGRLFSSYQHSEVALQKYAMINYLADKAFYLYTNSPDSRLDYKDERSDLSLMFWEIAMDYDGSLGSLKLNTGSFRTSGANYASNVSALFNEAYTHRNDALTMSIFSPTESPSQEFLALKRVNVPEPSTIALMLLGLSGIGISGLLRRKK